MTVGRRWTGLKRLWSDRRGSVATMFAMMALPVTVVAGFSIDLARAYEGHSKLQQAVDAAALALAHQPAGTPLATLDAQAQTWINADLHDSDLALPATVNVSLSNGELVLDAQSHEPAILSALVGINQFDMDATATTKWGLNHVEVALVLDNTGSMQQHSKLGTLISSSQTLVDTLLKQAGGDPNAVKISVVPFSMTVNVGQQYQGADWLTGVMPTAYGSDIFTTPNTDRFALFSQLHKTWGGCVEQRPAPYDVQDTPPSTGTPGTMFLPYFAPDEPDTPNSGSAVFYNNYLSDGLTGAPTWQQRQGDVAKYQGGAVKGGVNNATGYTYGPNAGCALVPLLRLTNDKGALHSTIGMMTAAGDTNLGIGLQWGWLTLSPSGPFGDGVAYNTPNTTKIIVLLTDGWNETTANGDADSSFYSGLGYIWQNRIGVTAAASQSQRNAALDSRTALACSNIKADGIVLYTVRIDVSGVSPAVLQTCATSPDKFFDVPNVGNLNAAFQQIAGQIGQLRIAQ